MNAPSTQRENSAIFSAPTPAASVSHLKSVSSKTSRHHQQSRDRDCARVISPSNNVSFHSCHLYFLSLQVICASSFASTRVSSTYTTHTLNVLHAVNLTEVTDDRQHPKRRGDDFTREWDVREAVSHLTAPSFLSLPLSLSLALILPLAFSLSSSIERQSLHFTGDPDSSNCTNARFFTPPLIESLGEATFFLFLLLR